ncbi:MAG: PEP-CTERM system TPR-repeat protein PrsT, partial [Minwuiales bacterium]|nr:PEP-CTERM system TPR-repeat protein PrsT [Minwuiales bacterium]
VYLKAALSYAQNQLEQAKALLEQYRARAPRDLRAAKLIAAVHLRQNAPADAIQVLEPIAGNNTDDFQLLALLGNAYMADQQFDKATELFEQAGQLDPDNTDLQTRLAASRLGLGDPARAVEELEGVIDRDPNANRANILLVLTHLRNRDYDQAEQAANLLKDRLKDSPIPDNFLGTVHLAKGDLEAARQSFDAALKVKSDYFPAALNLASIDRRENKPDEARARYREILAADPAHLRAMLALSEMAFGDGDADTGFDWLAKAANANPEAAEPRLIAVNAYLSRGEPDRAIPIARELAEVAPENGDALDALARAQLASGQTLNAVATYRRLTGLLPQSAPAHYRLAQAQAAAEQLKAARQTLDQAMTLDPAFLPAKQARLEAEQRLNGIEAALALGREWRDREPEAAVGHSLIGNLLFADSRFGEAIEAYEAAFDLEPSSELARRLYESHARAGDGQRGVGVLKGWLDTNEEDDEARFVLTSALIASGDHAGAIRESERLLERRPDNPIVLNNLAWLYDQSGDSRAVDYATRAHELAPQSPEIADTLGWMLVRQGEVERGLTLLRQANAAAPNHPEIGYHLAATLNKQGDRTGAREVLESVLGPDTNFQGVEDARALLKELGGG